MIVKEKITINETEYTKVYSDINVFIERDDGELYVTAIDPIDVERVYTETDIPVENEVI